MAATGISSRERRNPRGFMSLLSSAACEWFLIFLLFLDAALSYLLTKFACYCELQTPCLLCSRFDHVFGDKKSGYFMSLLCSNHKEEISSKVFCQVHGNLADVRAMCQECLATFATENILNGDLCNLMMTKLGIDIDRYGSQISFLSKNLLHSSQGPKTCCCCKKMWKARSSAQRLLQLTPVGFGASKAYVKPPLPRPPGHSRLSHRDSFKKIRDKISGPMSPRSLASSGVDHLLHVGYTELKITSDSESEFQVSDDDDGCSGIRGKSDSVLEYKVGRGKTLVQKIRTDVVASDTQACQSSEFRPSLLDRPMQLDANNRGNVSSQTSDDSVGHDSEELDCKDLSPETSPSVLPELTALGELQSPNISEVPPVSGESSKPNASLSHISDLSILSELISVTNIPSPSSTTNVPQRYMTETSKGGTNLMGNTTAKAGGYKDDCAPSISNENTQTDPSTLSHSGKVSTRLVEPRVASDAAKTEGGMKSLQRVSTSGMDELRSASPRNNAHRDENQRSDGVQMLQASTSSDKYDSGLEPIDGLSLGDNEGENIVDRLKQQIEHDRKCMNTLYKELEEERSASAIAANQTMAMITRLQEEKAALHMEALQYLRMMEEQAEYDMEALQRANDLLADREKEIQDLEAELELCRNNFQHESASVDSNKDNTNLKGEKVVAENHSEDHVENNVGGISDSKPTKISKTHEKTKQVNSSVCNFEDEKLYISQHLKKLEENLIRVSSCEASSGNVPKAGYLDRIKKEFIDHENLQANNGSNMNSQQEESVSSMHNDLSQSNGGPVDKSDDLNMENHIVSEESNHSGIDHNSVSFHGGDQIVSVIGHEISELNARLQALESDQDFLKHVSNLLQNGNDGLQFIQEIALQLQEVRKVEFKKRCQSVA